jgi:hypothetical protein
MPVERSSELESTLRHIADDRTATPEDRALAKMCLELIPKLRVLRSEGRNGEVVGIFENGKLIRTKGVFQDVVTSI